MNGNDLYMLLPLLVIGALPVLLMLLIAVRRMHFVTMTLSLVGFALAAVTLFIIFADTPALIAPLFQIDTFALFYMGLLFTASFVIIMLSYPYLNQLDLNREEYYILLFFATLGSAVLVISRHFISLFMGLEILSISLYSLIGYVHSREKCIEAGIKYLILAAASSAFLLFGMALIYQATGVLDFSAFSRQITQTTGNGLLITGGVALMIVGIGFKLAIVPFHMWIPDVYEGGPAPVTAFVASVSKGGMVALILRMFYSTESLQSPSILLIFTIIAIASMFTGNWLALLQQNVKRILAYSSIAHLGYLLVAFLAAGDLALEAVTFYLVAYFITTIGAFGVITVLSNAQREADELEDYRGFFWRKPWLAVVFTIMLFSQAGIPLTVGFIGKFYILMAGINSSMWLLVVILVINSVIGIFYYLRIIVTMLSHSESEHVTDSVFPVISLGGALALALLTVLLVWFGVFPSQLVYFIKSIAVLVMMN